MTTTTTNNNATVNAIVIAMSKEEVEMKTKDQIREMLETVGVEMSNTVFKKTKKAELVAMLEKYLDPSKKVEIVEAPVVEEKVTEKKEVSDMKKKDLAYNDAAWDVVVYALAKEYVRQSRDQRYVYENVSKKLGNSDVWKLFYKNTKSSIVPEDAYMVLEARLVGATCKVIKDNGGNPMTKRYVRGISKALDDLHHCLNAMVVRGYLSYVKVKGTKNEVNTVFYATAEQMNAMWKLSK